jgi:colicin import membrane protein
MNPMSDAIAEPMAPQESTSTALVPADAFAPGALAALVARIRADAMAEPRDAATEEGRKAIKSQAYKVARSKIAIDDAGKALGEEHRAALDRINADRRTAKKAMEDLQAEILAPLTAWEEGEAKRKALLEGEITRLRAGPESLTTAAVAVWVKALCEYPPRDWGEYQEEAEYVLKAEADRWAEKHAALVQADADAAELAALRAQRDRLMAEAAKRDAEVAAEAAARRQAEEAERQRIAAIEAEEEALREAETRREAAEAERRRMAEEAQARAEAAAAARIADMERQAREAETRAALALAQAERDAAEATRVGIEAERRRVAAQQAAENKEAERRAANKRRQAAVHNGMVAALLAVEGTGLTEVTARMVVAALAQGKIPHTTVAY